MNNNRVKNATKDALEASIPLALEMATDVFFGTIASGIISAKNTYKLEKFQENIDLMLNEIRTNLERLELKVEDVCSDRLEDIILLLEVLEAEIDEEKVRLFVNGFIYEVEEEKVESLLKISYYNALKELRINEIKYMFDVYVNKNYKIYFKDGYNEGGEIIDESEPYHLYIRSKIINLGILFKERTSWDGVTDADFEITKFGRGLIEYFRIKFQ